MPRGREEWSLHKGGDLESHRIAIRSGDRVRLRQPLAIRNHDGTLTGEVHCAGEVWTVLKGCAHEPEVIWLRELNGDSHTWSDDDFFEWFEVVSDS